MPGRGKVGGRIISLHIDNGYSIFMSRNSHIFAVLWILFSSVPTGGGRGGRLPPLTSDKQKKKREKEKEKKEKGGKRREIFFFFFFFFTCQLVF